MAAKLESQLSTLFDLGFDTPNLRESCVRRVAFRNSGNNVVAAILEDDIHLLVSTWRQLALTVFLYHGTAGTAAYRQAIQATVVSDSVITTNAIPDTTTPSTHGTWL